MISDLDTAPAPSSAQKRRRVKPETSALVVVGESPGCFWAVYDHDDHYRVLAVITSGELTAQQHRMAMALAPSGFGPSQTLAEAWGVALVWCDRSWRNTLHEMAKFGPVPFPKAQRLLFA